MFKYYFIFVMIMLMLMKKIIIKIIRVYQKVPGSWHNQCKFLPTCSNYAIEAIDRHGTIKGSFLALKRIIRCNPLSKGGIDMVPKKIKKLVIMLVMAFSLTGCTNLNTNNMTNINVRTDLYAIDFITKYLYADDAKIETVYPTNTDYRTYNLNKKQIDEFSRAELFVFTGLIDKNKNIATQFLKQNKNIKLIDATYKIDYNNDVAEMWLNPANAIMIAKNIKNGLNTYISNPYLNKKINDKFNNFNEAMTTLDAEYKVMADNSPSRTLVFLNDSFSFYSKYGFNIISLDPNKDYAITKFNQASTLIKRGLVKYIFAINGTKISKSVSDLLSQNNVGILYLDDLSFITDQALQNKDDFLSIMNMNKETLKKELYR